MNTATEAAPPEGVPPEPKPVVETTPKPSTEAGSQDHSKSRDPDKARAILRGEIPKEEAAANGNGTESETDAEVIARMFDPETGEYMGDDEAEDPPAGTAAEPTARPEAKTEAAAQDEETQPGEEDEEGAKPKKRISIKRGRLSDQDFAVVQFADAEKISLDEARTRLFGDKPAVTKTEAAPEKAPPTETPESVQEKINALLDQRKAANKALDVDKATELTDQIADLKQQQRDLQHNAQRAAQEQTARQTDAVIASATKAVELYPDSAVEGSELFEAIDAERLERQKTDPSFFQNKNWPMVLAVEIAAEMGVAPVTKKAAAEVKPPKPAATAPPKKPARPAPPNPAPGTTTGAAPTNQEDALRAELKIAKANKDANAIKAVMRKIDALPTAGR